MHALRCDKHSSSLAIFFALVVVVLTIGVAAAKDLVTCTATVGGAVELDLEDLRIDWTDAAPDTTTKGDFSYAVTSNTGWQIQVTPDTRSGKMETRGNKLETLESQMSLDDGENMILLGPGANDFTSSDEKTGKNGKKVDVTLTQPIGWNDQAKDSSDPYKIVLTFTVSAVSPTA